MEDGTVEDGQSLLSVRSLDATPDTITKLVMRIRALTFALLPVEVDTDTISVPSSRIITPDVIRTYVDAAGDFQEALPYALLRARWMFVRDAHRSAADFDENMGRAIACEVLARRIVHTTPADKLMSVMSTRYRYRARDGDVSSPSSALEIAIDQNCTIFLSSNEAQHVVNSLWKGDWVQVNNKDGDIDYVLYNQVREDSFWGRLDPSRLCVPRYQAHCRIIIWLFFLVVYSQAVRSPLQGMEDHIDPHRVFDEWEGILYAMALAFSMEEMHKVYMTMRYFTWRALGFWTVISALTDSLLITAFVFRLMGIWVHDEAKTSKYHMLSFQFLACVAPLIWMKLITVVEGYKYIGTMTICIARMLRESVVFFALLSILLAGFVQAMYALDASDSAREEGISIFKILLEGIMQAPDFNKVTGGVFGYILYSLWMLTSTVILLNILISLFSSAYEEIVDDAEAQYMAFFASKTVGMIRAPDTFVYPAPFNIIEGFLISPFELCTSSSAYATMNRVIMRVLFFIPLMMIALYESSRRQTPRRFWHQWILAMEGDDTEETSEYEDPQVEDNEEDGMKISKVPFEELVKRLPDTARSSEDTILTEIRKLQKQVAELQSRLDGGSAGGAQVKTE